MKISQETIQEGLFNFLFLDNNFYVTIFTIFGSCLQCVLIFVKILAIKYYNNFNNAHGFFYHFFHI